MKKKQESTTKTASTPADPVLAAEVKRAIAPYEGIYPPDVLLTMAEILEHALLTHPVGSVLLDRARPRKAPSRSGPQAKDEAVTETPGEAPAKKAGAK